MKKQIASVILSMILGGTAFTQGSGNALHYNTADGYVSTPLPSLFIDPANNDFTIETWLSVESSGTSKRVMFAQFNTSNFVSILINASNIPYVFVVAGGLNYSANTSTALVPGSWNHFAISWDASAKLISCYINGVFVSHISGGGSSTGTDNLMTIGSRTDGAQIFNGALDNMRIWNDIRTECEIYGSMTTEFTTPQPNLIADYNFNSGVGGANNAGITTLNELNGSFDGTLNSFVLDGTSSNWISSGATIYTQNKNDGTAYLTDTETDCESFTWIDGNTYTSSVSGITYSHNSGAGCPIVSTLNLTIYGLPPVNAGSDISVCEGETATLSGTGASTYTWDNGITDNMTFTPSATTTYTVEGTDANGCTNTDAVLVTVNTLPAVDAGSDQTVCAGYSVLLAAFGDPATYTWDNGVTDNVSFTPASTADYIVTASDLNGCVNTDTLTVTVNPLPATSVTQTGYTLSAAPAASYQWFNCDSADVITGETNQTYAVTATGNYAVIVTNVDGCTDTSSCTFIDYVGIETYTENTFRVYPNPAKDFVTLSDLDPAKANSLRVYDASGKLILTEQVTASILTLQTANLDRGIYILKIYSEEFEYTPVQLILN